MVSLALMDKKIITKTCSGVHYYLPNFKDDLEFGPDKKIDLILKLSQDKNRAVHAHIVKSFKTWTKVKIAKALLVSIPPYKTKMSLNCATQQH